METTFELVNAHPLTANPAWKELDVHSKKARKQHLRELFASDPDRGKRMTAEGAGIYLDYSKNRVTNRTINLLLQLAEATDLQARIDAMFRGEKINITENRAVLHVALRAPKGTSIVLDGVDVVPEVHEVLEKMADFCNRIRSGTWTGHTGKRIRNIVNIGIGGSDLGPVMAYEALKHYSDRAMTFRFVSNVDGTDFAEAVRDLDPAETLFIISSKTFTTLETMTNAHSARDWALAAFGGDPKSVAKHFVAVSTNAGDVSKFGIDTANMFGFWDWVGGRYSMDSAIGLSTMLAIGPDNFSAMLDGFHEMDEHFRTTPFKRNLPVLMGLLAIWNTNFLNAETVAVLPYNQYLKRFPAYLQQLTMESNGKHVTLDWKRSQVSNWPNLLGRAGNQRTAFFLSADSPGHSADPVRLYRFRSVTESAGRPSRHSGGKRFRADGGTGVRQDSRTGQCGRHTRLAGSASSFPGQPSIEHDSRGTTDAGITWEIGSSVRAFRVHTRRDLEYRSFDQWGVELGKVLAKRIIPELESPEEPKLDHDSSTNTLIQRYRKYKKNA